MFGRRARREAEVSDVLDRIRAHPAGSAQRVAALNEIVHLDAAVVVEQALAFCRSGRPDDAVIGLQALQNLPTPLVPRNLWPEIGQVTGVLCRPEQRDAEILAAAIPVHASAVTQERDPADFLRTMFRHEDGRVRAAAAASASAAHDPVSMIRPLLALLDEDPLPDVANDAAIGLARTICRDPEAAEVFTALFFANLDDPGQAVHAWNRARALLLGAPDPGDGPGPAHSDDLRDELRERLANLHGLDWGDHEIRPLVISMFIDTVNGATRRYAPAPGWDEQRHRAAVRDLLRRTRALPAGGVERDELLLRLIPDVSTPAWTDRHAVNIAVDEALTLTTEARGAAAPGAGAMGAGAMGAGATGAGVPGAGAVGVEALAVLVTFGSSGRSRQIRAVLADLRAGRPDDPVVLAAMLRTYSGLAARGLLDPAADRVGEFVLELLEHENANVRATAAMSSDLPGAVVDSRFAERLISLVDQDPDPAVRADAALGLASMAAAEADDAITDALVRLLDNPDPVIRAHALAWAVKTGRPDALERLLDELAEPDVRWEVLFIVQNLEDHIDSLPRHLHKEFTAALARLDETGWTDRTSPDADADDRTQILAEAAATLQLLAPIR
ncbi:HEAT repeat domain-containing protein [Actinomadura sp. 1N219]|uniref:HEAT repeat domain-containing protein n=1 Tax=Actinomadura sp. 1N219 TaxID=3375152 RepID=UPI0037A08063